MLVEVWLDNDALAGTLEPITEELDVPLMVYRDFAADTFAWDAIQFHRERDERRKIIVLHLGDFDRPGEDARNHLGNADPSLRRPTVDGTAGSPVEIGRLIEFGRQFGVQIEFRHLAVTLDQIPSTEKQTGTPIPFSARRRPKRGTAADKAWPYDFAVELDAIPPDTLRAIVRGAIEEQPASYRSGGSARAGGGGRPRAAARLGRWARPRLSHAGKGSPLRGDPALAFSQRSEISL